MADPHHGAVRIAPPFARAPSPELVGDIVGGLSRQRRIARPCARAPFAMARGARLQPPRGVARVVEAGRFGSAGRRARQGRCTGRPALPGVVFGDADPRTVVEPAGDPLHLRMAPLAGCVEFELAQDVALVETGEARNNRPVSSAVEAVTGDAGSLRTGVSPAHRDEFAGLLESFGHDGTVATRCSEP